MQLEDKQKPTPAAKLFLVKAGTEVEATAVMVVEVAAMVEVAATVEVAAMVVKVR